MSDLISRQDAINAIEKCHKRCCRADSFGDEWIHYETTLNEIEGIKSTQEIIYCENCEHWDTSWETVHGLHYCPMIDLSTKKDFFCKDGIERKGDTE